MNRATALRRDDATEQGAVTTPASIRRRPKLYLASCRRDDGSIVTFNAAGQATVAYDNLGRRTSINNPDTGQTETQYDLASNVTAKITANLKAASQAITYAYDYSRLKSSTYPVTTGNNIAYEYGGPAAAGDAQGNRAGRITKITSQMGVEERTYGKLGEVTYEKKTVTTFTDPLHPSVFETRYQFDTFGRMLKLTYPDGELLTNAYDSGGNLKSAAGEKRVDSQGQNHRYHYLHGLYYDKFEQRVLMEQGNGVKTVYAYDAKTRRLARLAATRQGSNLFQDLNYDYDQVGNVLSLKNLTDLSQANTYGGPSYQRYQYDDLYRLTQAQGVFPYNQAGANPDASACASGPGIHCRVYSLQLAYSSIHNIQTKNQTDTRHPPRGQRHHPEKDQLQLELRLPGPPAPRPDPHRRPNLQLRPKRQPTGLDPRPERHQKNHHLGRGQPHPEARRQRPREELQIRRPGQ